MADYSLCDWCGEKDPILQPAGEDGVQMICRSCVNDAIAKAERDDEMRSLRGYSDEEKERI